MEIKLCQINNSHGGFHETKHLIYRYTNLQGTFFFLQFSASDNPHGRFRIASNTQRITVENDLSRVLRFTIQRIEGKFGDVRVNYQLVYSRNYPGSLNGFVVIRNEESDVSFGRDLFSRLYSKRHRPANARQL